MDELIAWFVPPLLFWRNVWLLIHDDLHYRETFRDIYCDVYHNVEKLLWTCSSIRYVLYAGVLYAGVAVNFTTSKATQYALMVLN